VEGSDVLSRYRKQIEAEVAQSLPAGGSRLDEMQRYALGWTEEGLPNLGKGLRPSLCLLTCESLGGDIDRALPVAVAIELIHNFSLIHDDIEDGDIVRHHRPALWHVYGRDEAIAAGIALWSTAYQTLSRAAERGLDTARLLEARGLTNDACQQMIEGQHLDLTYEQRTDVTLNEYLQMIACKTGALLGASTQTGALIAGADAEESERFGVFGQQLGLAFQIRDDILGIWGEGSATGKPVGADIARKKKSLPIVQAFQQVVGPDRELLRSVYSSDTVGDEDVDAVLSILQRWNCRYFAQGLAEDYRSRAMAALSKTHIPAEARYRFDEITAFILERDY
jgi:geranylgeranyl diphosphate synthase type I